MAPVLLFAFPTEHKNRPKNLSASNHDSTARNQSTKHDLASEETYLRSYSATAKNEVTTTAIASKSEVETTAKYSAEHSSNDPNAADLASTKASADLAVLARDYANDVDASNAEIAARR